MSESHSSHSEAMKTRLRGDLRAAMKRGDKVETSLLRQLIAVLDNAEAVPAPEESASLVRHVFGEGTNEVERRQLGHDDIRALLQWEMDARRAASAECARLGAADRAAILAAEAAMVGRYIGA